MTHRPVIAAVAAAILLVGVPTAASARSPGGRDTGQGPSVGAGPGGTAVQIVDRGPGGGSGAGSQAAGGPPAAAPGGPAAPSPQQIACMTVVSDLVVGALTLDPALIASPFVPGGAWSLCTAAGGAPGVAHVETPAQVVEQQFTFNAIKLLPEPHITIQPDDTAVTGLAAYLETTPADDPWTMQVADPVANATLTVRCALHDHHVDWGDGEVADYPFDGTGYPSGRITHVYQESGPRTVTVTEYWDCSWSGAGQSQAIAGPLHSPPVSVAVDVREIQALNR